MYFIAEIGINHNGDIGTAKQLIAMAKGCGAHAVKFQKRTIDEVYDEEFLASPRKSPWGTTQFEQKKGLEFNFDEYDRINTFCKALEIDWFASAWDLQSLYFIDAYSPPYHKIASAMLTNHDFVDHVAKLKKPVILSTGMSTTKQIVEAVKTLRDAKVPKIVVMHCISVYPCNDDACNVRNVEHLAGMFPDCEIGYSGHERGIIPSITAIALGATYIERHITLDRTMYGSDQAASLERPGLARLIEYGNQVVKCLGKPGLTKRSDAEMAVAKKLRYWEAV